METQRSSVGDAELPARNKTYYKVQDLQFEDKLSPSEERSTITEDGLLCIGFLLSTLWAGIHVCAPDAFAWNLVLVLVNTIHTILLTHRFLPSSLSLELTELYLKLFKPLRVSKKHFKELSKEGQLMHLEQGENYAVEDITSADEKLSILLKGKLRVTCDDIHLHYINPHQFIDSPEWEANHENSDDVFQLCPIPYTQVDSAANPIIMFSLATNPTEKSIGCNSHRAKIIYLHL
uniref:POPDC1-3 domain-containing protein n=1 Tax=Timema tahoe TaxID=61484 RepID=A0A7R9IGN5_9NEOP|nr:unnamed protein product [Timema tahoe]